MASNNFKYRPTSGTRWAYLDVAALSVNTTSENKVSRIVFTNGYKSCETVVKQKYRPYFIMTGSSIPSTGGSLDFVVHTEYDIVFLHVPSWITISKGSTTYTQGQRITASDADGQTFRITAANNPGQSRVVNDTFNMSHYIRDNVQSEVQYFSFIQNGNTQAPNITIEPLLFEVAATASTVSVDLIVQNCTFGRYETSTAGTFTITASGPVSNRITLSFSPNTLTTSRTGVISFYLYDSNGNAYNPKTVYVTQAPAGGISVDVANLVFDYNETEQRIFHLYTSGNWTSSIRDN
jgi:hypothetical protein